MSLNYKDMNYQKWLVFKNKTKYDFFENKSLIVLDSYVLVKKNVFYETFIIWLSLFWTEYYTYYNENHYLGYAIWLLNFII